MRYRLLSPLLAAALLAPVHAQELPQPTPDAPVQQPEPAQQEPARVDTPAQDAQEQDAPDVAPSDDPDASESAASKVPLDEIKRFVGVYNAVREAYVDPVSDDKLMHSAIKGLLLDHDPHSTYFDKDDAQAFDEETSGAYDGIGVEVQPQADGSIKVIAPIDDTPAARAGLKSGDVIVAVDGKPLQPGGDDQGPLRGKPGTKVVLTLVREGTPKPFDVPVMRETIRIASVRGRLLEPGYGYIRVAAFQADTAADFEKVLARLQGESGGGKTGNSLRGLVLDLRSNPGGLLVSAVQIADDLLDKGGIVSTRGRTPISDTQFTATPGDRLQGAPLVVLVDAGSASAAEVLAGALDDNHRARIVGSRTFGKGSVQTLLPLDNGDSVKLTTARYYTPSGKSIQARGIEPDVVLHPAKDAANGGKADYAEALLPGHLHGDEEGEAGSNAGDVLDGDAPIAAALAELKKMGAATNATAAAKRAN
jgi:carboxyl-terminal processing protease